jgi:hypothetical protein
MSLGPFLSMLTSQALFQTRVDAFKDASEGAYGYKNSDLTRVASALKLPWRTFSDNEGEYREPPEKEEIIRVARARTAVTCWFRGFESFSMWQIYARDHFGVAVVTTLGALRQAFENAENVVIGEVTYDRLPPVVADTHKLFFHKRAEYRDECEIRSVNVLPDPITDPHPMITLPPNTIDSLFANVVAAPGMQNTMFSSLLRILQTQFSALGLTFNGDRLRHSDLDDDLV